MEYNTGWWFQPTYPSEKWWNESQLGWRHSQVNGKMKFMFQTTNQKCAMLTRGYHQVFPIIWLVFDAIEPPRFWSSGLSGPHFRTPATPPRCNLPSEAQQVGPNKKVEWNPWHMRQTLTDINSKQLIILICQFSLVYMDEYAEVAISDWNGVGLFKKSEKKEIGFVFSSPVCTGVVWKQGIKKSNTFPIQNLQYIFFWATPKSLEKPNVRMFAAKLQFWWLHRYTTHVWPKKRPFLKGFKPTWTAVHCGIPHFWENPGWSYRCVSQNIPLCCMLSPGSHTTVHSIRMLLTLPILDILPETTSWLVYNKRSGKVLHKSGVPGQVLIVCELVE